MLEVSVVPSNVGPPSDDLQGVYEDLIGALRARVHFSDGQIRTKSRVRPKRGKLAAKRLAELELLASELARESEQRDREIDQLDGEIDQLDDEISNLAARLAAVLMDNDVELATVIEAIERARVASDV